MTADPRRLDELLEESQDLQAGAIAATKAPLAELVESGRDTPAGEGDLLGNRRFFADHQTTLEHSLKGAAVLGAAGGAVLVGLLASPAFASSSPDMQMLQTAASIENLAVSTYKTALTLPYIGGATANAVVTKFCMVTESQHAQHARAFNAAVKQLGGKAQNKPDPAFVPVVKKAVASLSGVTASQGALGVVALALELENIAAETYVNDAVKASGAKNKALFASIMGVEAQHAAVLLAVQALLKGGAPQLIALSPTTVTTLPAAAGSVGFPNAFYPISNAAPDKQGAVK
jgi:rubrerythrin